jgi:hypothetical protein
MGSLNSGLLNIEEEVKNENYYINMDYIKHYSKYNELDRYKYEIYDYWRNMITNIDNTS